MDKSLLALSADKQAQLTRALSNTGLADPLQTFCDEAAAKVSRMTTGYVLDSLSAQSFTRALALYKAYSLAGPVPADVKFEYDETQKELEAIAKGERPNLPKVSTPAQATIAGSWGAGDKVAGRIPGQS